MYEIVTKPTKTVPHLRCGSIEVEVNNGLFVSISIIIRSHTMVQEKFISVISVSHTHCDPQLCDFLSLLEK